MGESGCLKDGHFQNLSWEGGGEGQLTDLTISGHLNVTGELKAQPPLFLPNSEEHLLTEVDHAGRLLYVPLVLHGDLSYRIPNPTSTNIVYNFLYIGSTGDDNLGFAAVTTHPILIRRNTRETPGAGVGVVFLGNILTTRVSGELGPLDTTTVFANGSTHDQIHLRGCASSMITLRCIRVAEEGVHPAIFLISGYNSAHSHVTIEADSNP
jgi:hypothetical protein